jgi:Tfp pilus assembly protein PilN
MIEINLLPGAGKKSRKETGLSFGAIAAGAGSRIKDPYLLAAIICVAVAGATIGLMHVTQTSRADELSERERRAVQDSTRFVAVLRERHKAEAQRDSVRRQLDIIKSIDNDRFVWPHILDEVSRALPPYTWLRSIQQTSAVQPVAQPAQPGQEPKKVDPEPTASMLRFRIVGNTVDIQALTRFMKVLEMSPFVQNIQLARSGLAMVDGKEVTEFQLDAEYQRPDSSVISTVPVSLSVR